MSLEETADPHILVGCAFQDGGFPNFAVPLFRNLESNELTVQVVGADNRISFFSKIEIEAGFEINNYQQIIREGDEPVVILAGAPDSLTICKQTELQAIVERMLHCGDFDAAPLFALDMANFVGDTRTVEKLHVRIYNHTLAEYPRTRRFFLENNIAREALIDVSGPEMLPEISKMRIHIDGNRIKMASPTQDYDLTSEMGKAVIARVKNATNIAEPQLSFDHSSSSKGDWQETFSLMKFGFPNLSREILDSGSRVRFLTYKDAICLIPDLAITHSRGEESSTEVLRRLTKIQYSGSGLSNATISKAVLLKPIAMRSAQLIRFWIFADKSSTEHSLDYRIHLCCLLLKTKEASILDRLVRGRVIDAKNRYTGYVVFTFSMLCFLLEMKVLDKDEIGRSFVFSTSFYFSRPHFTETFIGSWLEFAVRNFRSYSAADIDGTLPLTLRQI